MGNYLVKTDQLLSKIKTLHLITAVLAIFFASTSVLLSCAGKPTGLNTEVEPATVQEKEPTVDAKEQIIHISGAISRLQANNFPKKEKKIIVAAKQPKKQEIKKPPPQKAQVVKLTKRKKQPAFPTALDKQHISGAFSKSSKNPFETGDQQNKSEEVTLLTSKKIAGSDQDLPLLRPEIANGHLALQFNQTDVIEIVDIIADHLKFDYIVDPGVGGKITIHTADRIPTKNLFSVLKQILSTNNLTIIKEGHFYRVTQMAESQRKPLRTFMGNKNETMALDDTMIIQIIPLKYLPADLLSQVLAPLLTKGGRFLALPSPELLAIVDTAANIHRLLKIIKIMDINSFEKMSVKLFPIKFGKASDLSKELESIFTTLGISQKDQYFKFLPVPRLNSILTVSANSQYIKLVSDWIKKLDIMEVGEGKLGTYIYTVQNGEASNIASIIQTLFKTSGKKLEAYQKKKPETKKTQIAGVKTVANLKKKIALNRTIEISGTTKIEGELDIVSDSSTNSIIIRTSPRNYPIILDTMKQLDKMPLQVMIEIMVADLTLDHSTRFGIEWAIRNNSITSGTSTEHFGDGIGDNPIFNSSGASYFLQNTGSLLGFIQTKASESKLNILSSPVILTSENKSASISITSDVPIEVTTRDSNGLTTTSYEYKSAGIKLSVTPRINSERFVSMEISQEVSTVGEKPAGATDNAPPPFFTRKAQTSVVVKDQETLVIGGLIDNTKSSSQSGIPFLSKIPLLGRLFGNNSESKRKTELIILITPRVIETVGEARLLTNTFKERIEFIQNEIKMKESKE